MTNIHTYHKGRLEAIEGTVVQEFPLILTVNGRELATLVASPHELRYLVAGFLRLQGFVTAVEDFELLSVCNDYGIANVRIRGELPERLRPILTSGCGTGVTFSLPVNPAPVRGGVVHPDAVLSLMDQLAGKADQYRSHGGIHSAAVGNSADLILYAEDIGRHNTLDRIAGEALLKGIDLAGMLLVTSGRVSAEMASKAALLGVSTIASRTSPTDMAVNMCAEAGITLIGYVRGGRFQVYSHPERLEMPLPKVAGVTGVILAGGKSSRMGQNKALIPFEGKPLIATVYRKLAAMFDEVLVVTNSPEEYAFLPCRKVPDIFVNSGSMAGVHSGLVNSRTQRIFVAGCDMPYLDERLIRSLAEMMDDEKVLVPQSDGGLEPLHAFYAKGALPGLESALTSDKRRIVELLAAMGAKVVPPETIAAISPDTRSFININSPEDYQLLMADSK